MYFSVEKFAERESLEVLFDAKLATCLNTRDVLFNIWKGYVAS